MVAADVEAEHDSAAQRRALRAARQTVRIELPADFGRPGSAMLPGLTPGTSTALPLPEPEVTLRGLPLRRYAPWLLAGMLLLAAVLLVVLRPRSGSLVVTALGAGHRAVESVQIFVDGKPLCDSSPCRISGLTAGAHKLRAIAPGLSSEEQLVEIASGEESAANIELSAQPDLQGGGVRVAAGDRELTLYVDDRRVGKLPQTVAGLAAGKHWIKLDPEDGTPPIEKSVSVQAGEMLDVEPRAARRDKVVVTIQLSPDSEGASVTFDDAFLLDFPAELELDPRSSHTLTATKPGYEDFTQRLDLGDETEKRIEVALTPLEGASARPRARAKPSGSSGAASAAARKSTTPVSKPASPLADSSQGLLNISSVPPSQIILNGRPLGSTPKTAVVVPGDSLQTIVFVHPKMGRRRAQKFVPAGKERTVSIRF
jgi:serine/threonine-protein kinase